MTSPCTDSGKGCFALPLHLFKFSCGNLTAANLGVHDFFHVLTDGTHLVKLTIEIGPPFGEEAVERNRNLIFLPDIHKLERAYKWDAQSKED